VAFLLIHTDQIGNGKCGATYLFYGRTGGVDLEDAVQSVAVGDTRKVIQISQTVQIVTFPEEGADHDSVAEQARQIHHQQYPEQKGYGGQYLIVQKMLDDGGIDQDYGEECDIQTKQDDKLSDLEGSEIFDEFILTHERFSSQEKWMIDNYKVEFRK
jgi:hypothetical protein